MKPVHRADCHGHPVRYVLDQDQVWFFSCDIARASGYGDRNGFLDRVPEHDMSWGVDPAAATGQMRLIRPTAAVKKLTRSRKPQAKAVMEWIEELVISLEQK